MAEVFINLVLGKLCDAVLQEIFFLCEVNDKIEHIKRELNRIQCFLRDADNKSVGDVGVKNWTNELRGVSHWIEDTVDLFIMELDELSGKNACTQKPNLKEKFKKMFKKSEKLVIAHKFGKKIDRILTRIDEIAKSREKYGITNLGESSQVGVSVPFKRPIIPDLDDTELVGVRDEKEKIVAQLLDEKCLRRSIVSIVGPGGLGKTTVAEKAYSSNAVKSQFEVRLWLSVSQNFRLIDLLRKMLKGIRPLNNYEKDEAEDYFRAEVNKSLRENKYLVVLDDIWSDDLWSQIVSALPDVKNGSRVLMTSRIFNIPKAADPESEPNELRYLDEAESLELLLKTALPNRDDEKDCRTNLLDIAKKLAKKCDGLPLALIALGGNLSIKPPMLSVWEKVLNTIVWSVDGKKCMDILVTSYDDMPVNLKTCFMYLACFLEDSKINAQDLIRLWVAEGLIPQISSKTMEDTAEDYLEELAQRSMIKVLERSLHDNSILTCRIHDLLHDVAINKAKINNFMTICSNGDRELDLGEARRVVIHNSDSNELMKFANPNLRTLLCFNSELPNCSAHRLTKVLYVPVDDMNVAYAAIMMERIEGLSQLRYLKLGKPISAPSQECLDKLIGSMKFLQTLHIQHLIPPCQIPNSMWHIKTFRHIVIPWYADVAFLRHPQSIVLQNLQTLIGGRSQLLETTNLPNVPNLLRLKIPIRIAFPWRIVTAFLRTLKKLVVLEIEGDEIPIEVLDMKGYPFYQHLTSLSYIGSFYGHGRDIIFRTTMFPISLTMLTFQSSELRQDHINVLEKLPELKVLKLLKEHGSPHAYMDETMRCSAGGFPHLEYLVFYFLTMLKVWEIEKGAMPMLKSLTVKYCRSIEVPFGMQHLTVLHDLTWVRSGQFETMRCIQDLCKHVPFVTCRS